MVLTRDTPLAGASALAEQLCKEALAAGAEVECTLYPFPPASAARSAAAPAPPPTASVARGEGV
jgi:hypothetical protein